MGIIFFGNERLATGVTTSVPVLSALIEAGYNIPAVISNYTSGSSRNKRTLEIGSVAEAHNIPLLLPTRLSEIYQQIINYKAEMAVLVAYGKIIPQEVIDIFPRGIINIHPSLLPLHRGPTPIESVILAGEAETGVSLMQLAKEMDSGPLYAQSTLQLSGTETKQVLADKLLDLGSSMLITELPSILDGHMSPMPQDAQATYDKQITKDMGLIDWTKPADQLEREIRAYAGWPGSRTTLAGKEVIITQARAEQITDSRLQMTEPGKVVIQDKQLGLQTSDGILVIEKLKPAGKSEMTAQAFLAGYGQSLK